MSINRQSVARTPQRAPRKVLKLTQPELLEFAAFFYDHTGIAFAESKHGLLQTQVSGVFNKLGYETFTEALTTLKSARGATDLQQVVNALTINETYFYREKYQFDALANTILPELTASAPRGGRVRIWCLPCATGEEPYSVAIYLRENWPGWNTYSTSIFGSDIDTNVLKTAQKAQYSVRALSRMPKPLHAKYFKASSCGTRFSLNRDVADSVTFNQINLTDRKMTSTMNNMDVIFCRNVLIYLDDKARRSAVKNLYDSLKHGGCLLLGHAESMSWMSDLFKIERKGGSVIYRK